ncbi:MAG: glycosyltransferase family 4 protein, partial [Acidobacteriota bacterium]
MNIAFVAPSPKPFACGGAERLWSHLAQQTSELTDHQVELIKLPVDERTQGDLLSAYQAFSALDLSHFDGIVSGKYPAWMVGHRRHICYVLHRLRGLYDFYPADARKGCPPSGPHGELMLFLRQYRGDRDGLVRLFELYREASTAGEDTELVGPLTRKVVHFLDDFALSPMRMWRHFAISHQVADRAGYFPAGSKPEVLHPPTPLEGLRGGSDDYFFTVSRLDSAKRIDLLIKAFRQVDADIPFLIAGEGRERTWLRNLSVSDKRIRFLGQVSDKRLRELYGDALAVPFAPLAEDFGLVALEAMKSKKPVITATDSGGPCELVVDGETGLIAKPTPESLASAMQDLVDHRRRARQLGLEAEKSVREIDWPRTISRLFADLEQVNRSSISLARRPKAVVATTFPVTPPRQLSIELEDSNRAAVLRRSHREGG